MKHKLATILLLVVALLVATFSVSTTTTTPTAKAVGGTFPVDSCPDHPDESPPCPGDNRILRWDEQLLSTIRAHPKETGPTITARALGVLHTATYNAWAAYDPVAKGTRTDGPAPQQANRNTLPNKNEAISYAAYRVLNDLFPSGTFPCIPNTCPTDGTATYLTPDILLQSQGYDPANTTPASTTDTAATPAGVGNLAAKAVLDDRHNDGSNQLNGYQDTTGYTWVNTWQTMTDPWRWQPMCVPLVPYGTPCNSPSTEQKPLTPQWGNVVPFSLTPSQYPYMVPGPPKLPGGAYNPADIDTELADSSNLDQLKKAKAEYWADGPKSEFPPGHTAVFAQAVSRKNGNTLDTDAKMFLMVGNAMMDASIAAWWQKYRYDFVRPTTAIRERYYGQYITSWKGPNQGFGLVLGQDWRPYQAANVVTPPFPEYVSGHSTFTAAGASLLALFRGSDTFGASITIPAGSWKIESGPTEDVTLSWATFSDASNEAGWSRRYGGIHFKSADEHGRALGRQVAQFVYAKAQSYIRGNAGR